jgi:hypothetical protein
MAGLVITGTGFTVTVAVPETMPLVHEAFERLTRV